MNSVTTINAIATLSKSASTDGLPTPRRYWAVVAIWLTLAMAVLDGTFVIMALPEIARQMDTTPALSIWIINGYQLAITMLLLPVAALGDRIGQRQVYLAGIGLFLVGSLTCAGSNSFSMLVAGRVVQGMGASCIMSLNAAMVRSIYPSAQLGRGIGYNAMVLSLSSAAGPTMAALMLGVVSWPWLFLINLPIGLAALVIAIKALPEDRGRGRSFDWRSAALSGVMLGSIVFGAETMARESSRAGVALLATGAVAGIFLLRREWSRPAPLVPLDLLRVPIIGLSALTSVVSFGAQMIPFVALPFYLQWRLGLSIFETGLLMSAWPLVVIVVAPVAGRLADRYPAGLLGGIGLAVFAVGLFMLAQISIGSSPFGIAWRIAVCGMGFGFFQSPNNRIIIGSAPRHRSGAAGGLLATSRLLGQTWGAVTVSSMFNLGGLGATPTLFRGAAVVAALAAVISLLRLRTPRVDANPLLKPMEQS